MKMFPDQYDYLQITIQLDYLFNSVFRINPFTSNYLSKHSRESNYYLPTKKNKMGYGEKILDEKTIEELLIRLLPSLGDPNKRKEYSKRLAEDTDTETIAKVLAKIISSSSGGSQFEYFEKTGDGYRFKHFNKYISYLFGLLSATYNLDSTIIMSTMDKLNESRCLVLRSRPFNRKIDKVEYYKIARDYKDFVSIWNSISTLDNDEVIVKKVDSEEPEKNSNSRLRKDYTNPFHTYHHSIDPYKAINELIIILKACGITLK